MQRALAWVDGRIQPMDETRVPYADRAYLLGDGLFETLRADGGDLFRAPEHRERMAHGLRVLGWSLDLLLGYDDALEALAGAAADADIDPARIRIQVTGGQLQDIPGLDSEPVVTGMCMPLHGMPLRWYQDGISVTFAQYQKNSGDALSTIKSTSYLPHVHAKREAIRCGFDDALIRNGYDRVVEATSGNVIAFQDGVLYAPGPKEGALAGVTRSWVLDQAAKRHWRVENRLSLERLLSADEVWMTNTTGGVMPVTHVEGKPVGNGRPGAIGQQLEEAYRAALRREIVHA